MIYLLLKTLHIMSSVLLVGTGFGSAFYLFFINRTRSVQAIAAVSRLVVRADFWFTTPTVIFQPLSGILLMQQIGYPWSSWWIMVSLVLFTIAGLCWLPVVYIQIKMAKIAQHCAAHDQPLPEQYWRYAKRWEYLGYPAFVCMLGIYFLMVYRPMESIF